MRKETLGGHTFEFYDTIDSLPAKRFHLYTKHILVLTGIGDSLDSIDSHIEKLVSYIQNDPKRAMNELMNYRRCIYAIMTEADYRHKANLCLVKKVDGQEWTDFSEEGINTLYEMVNTEEERKLRQLEGELRHRIDEELMTYFPDIFHTSLEKEQTTLLYRRAKLQLAEIINGEDNTDAIKVIDNQLLAMYESKIFEGRENAEVELDKQFEEMCLVLAKEFGGRVKDYSVMEFYTANKILSDRQKQMNKARKK